MASELFKMMERDTEPIKLAYEGGEEAFLKKVVTPIYKTIAEVACFLGHLIFFRLTPKYSHLLLISICVIQEAKRSGEGKHSKWRNYDDLNEYFWYNIRFIYQYLTFTFPNILLVFRL